MLLHLSTKLSRLTQEKDGLTREIAFLRLELEELRAPRRADAGERA